VFEYTPTIEDHVAFNLWRLDANGTAEKLQRQLWWNGLAACLLLFMVPVGLVLMKYVDPLPAVLLTWPLCGLMWLALASIWPDVTRVLLTRRLARIVRRNSLRTHTVRIWLDGTGVCHASDAGGTRHYAWSAFRHLGETADHLFMVFADDRGLILPKWVAPEMNDQFARQFRANVDNALVGPPARPVNTADESAADPARPQDDDTHRAAEVAERPDEWLPAFGQPAPSTVTNGDSTFAAFTMPAVPPMLTYAVTPDDIASAVLGHSPARRRAERAVRMSGWRRWWTLAASGFGLVVIGNLILLRFPLDRAVATALAVVGLFALLKLSQLEYSVKTGLRAALEKLALKELASGGDQRQVWVGATGVTIADNVVTQHLSWEQLVLSETDRHVVLASEGYSYAIPKRLGQPVAILLGIVRSRVA